MTEVVYFESGMAKTSSPAKGVERNWTTTPHETVS